MTTRRVNGRMRGLWCLAWTAVLCVSSLVAGDAAGPAQGGDDGQLDGPSKALRKNMRAVRRAAMSAPASSPAAAGLRSALDRLNSLRTPRRRPPSASGLAPTRPAGAATTSTAPAGQTAPSALTEEALKYITTRPAKDVIDPIALADSVYLGGHVDAAFALYEKAARSDSLPAEDKAWALYQMANCRWVKDPDIAAKLHERVMAEHPDSHWAGPAKVQQRLLEWQKLNEPQAMLSPPAGVAAAPPPASALPAAGGRGGP